MASLRTASAARLLRTNLQNRALLPATRRFESGVAVTRGEQAAHQRTDIAPPASATPNNPQYEATPVDKATSTFTPVPKRVLDGSEDNDILPAGLVSGAPIELQGRTVRIYKPTKPATQSGNWQGKRWRMDWDILPKGHRWENPLMGWQSSGDMMQGTHLNFKSKEDAVAFAEKQGYEYFVQEPNERKIVPKAYANNFLWSAKKLKHIRSK